MKTWNQLRAELWSTLEFMTDYTAMQLEISRFVRSNYPNRVIAGNVAYNARRWLSNSGATR